jgi:hypothetical protein
MHKEPDSNQVVTAPELAEILQISRPKVRDWSNGKTLAIPADGSCGLAGVDRMFTLANARAFSVVLAASEANPTASFRDIGRLVDALMRHEQWPAWQESRPMLLATVPLRPWNPKKDLPGMHAADRKAYEKRHREQFGVEPGEVTFSAVEHSKMASLVERSRPLAAALNKAQAEGRIGAFADLHFYFDLAQIFGELDQSWARQIRRRGAA